MAQGNQVIKVTNPVAGSIEDITYNPATNTLHVLKADGSSYDLPLNDKHIKDAKVIGPDIVLTREDGSEFVLDITNAGKHLENALFDAATQKASFVMSDASVVNLDLKNVRGTLTSLNLVSSTLMYKDENGITTGIDLSSLDKHVASGVLNKATSKLILNMSDGSSVEIDVADLNETVTSMERTGMVLNYTDEKGVIHSVDLSDLNIHVVSGHYTDATQHLTLTNSDGSNFDIDMNDVRGKVTSLQRAADELIYKDENGTNTIIDLSDYHSAGVYIPLAEKGQANGVATLDGGGRIPQSQIPPLAITEIYTVSKEADLLTLNTGAAAVNGGIHRGDMGIVTDVGKTFVANTDGGNSAGEWTELVNPVAPPPPVDSVNGKTGVVVLSTDDIGETANNMYLKPGTNEKDVLSWDNVAKKWIAVPVTSIEIAGRAFKPHTTYEAGDVVFYNGYIYTRNTTGDSGATFDISKWSRVEGVPVFSNTMHYRIGDVVSHGGKLYIANKVVSAGSAFNPAEWDGVVNNKEVVDDLVTGGTDVPLSAQQGVVLASIISSINADDHVVSATFDAPSNTLRLKKNDGSTTDVSIKGTYELNDLIDVVVSPATGSVLWFNPTTLKWENREPHEVTIDDTLTNGSPGPDKSTKTWSAEKINNELDLISAAVVAKSEFTGLTDTPNSYTGQAGKLVRVKADESGVEFADLVLDRGTY